MDAVQAHLVRRDRRLVLLADAAHSIAWRTIPATSKATRPVCRENGGQYTHAACGW
jgi:cellobiose phosphorylase